MKFVRVIILIALVVSFMPLDAFCEDHHDPTEHCHGIVLCHGSCHSAVLSNNSTLVLPDYVISYMPQNSLFYEAPILPTEERPPLSLLS